MPRSVVLVVVACAASACAVATTDTNAPPKSIDLQAGRGLDVVATQTAMDSAGDRTSAYLYVRVKASDPVAKVSNQMQANGWTMVPVKAGTATGNYAGYFATVQSTAAFDRLTGPTLNASIPTTAAAATAVIVISGP